MELTNVLREIRKLFKEESKPINEQLWCIIAAVVISALNHPKDLAEVYNLVSSSADELEISLENKQAEMAKVVLRLREAILKSFIVTGFPKAINTLQSLHDSTPEAIRKLIQTTPLRLENTWEEVSEQRKKGRALFTKIYERHTDLILNHMGSSYPDLAQAALHQLYGSILSEIKVIGAKETSLIMVACLLCDDLPAQLKGHRYGALNNGATRDELGLVESAAKLLCDHYSQATSLPRL
ncbi:hypothetical protein CLU79DRAFT_751466 [Phycomyces nitens]|nr:hypothetical protein CLU79DRAFT_751466 [Phycomyces nitens]